MNPDDDLNVVLTTGNPDADLNVVLGDVQWQALDAVKGFRVNGRVMSIRVDSQIDHESPSMRYVVTATLDGKRLHEVDKFGGPEVRDEVFREMTAWLKGKGHSAPDHYWLQTFPT